MIARALFFIAMLISAAAANAASLRLGVQKTGSLAWELAIVKAQGLDKAAGLDLEIVDQATTEAGKLALSGGAVDIILSDWLWVARERSLGRKLKFAPYSSAPGALMVKSSGPIAALTDLKGKTLGVAGGPLDKSWLLLQAFAKPAGFDVARDARVVFGAPPLLAEKAVEGELDGVLEFWNFAAGLEAKGFKRLVDLHDVEKSLGASGAVAMVGYVFDEDFAAAHADVLARFFAMSEKAQLALGDDEKAWEAIALRAGASDAAAAGALFRKRYREGAPRPAAQEEADARILFKALAEIGGEALVGKAQALDAGVYYKAQ